MGDRDLVAGRAGHHVGRRAGLASEPRIVDGSSVRHAKPAPDLLLRAAREARVAPEATWYVGDSTWDMRAAVTAAPRHRRDGGRGGLGEALREAGADAVIGSLDQLELGR